jgi:hypothetical protein
MIHGRLEGIFERVNDFGPTGCDKAFTKEQAEKHTVTIAVAELPSGRLTGLPSAIYLSWGRWYSFNNCCRCFHSTLLVCCSFG